MKRRTKDRKTSRTEGRAKERDESHEIVSGKTDNERGGKASSLTRSAGDAKNDVQLGGDDAPRLSLNMSMNAKGLSLLLQSPSQSRGESKS